MLTINTNVASLTSQRNLSGSQNALSTSLERLSSGLRINSAKDDAAGLAIADRMTGQIRGLDQAKRNANDGISLSQTAEGALSEISNNLQRIRELSVQAANDTNSASDRAALQSEVSQLQQEITRVAGNTQFNGKNLLDGTFTAQSFQVGANANQSIAISLNNAKASNIGANNLTATGTLNNATAAGATKVVNTVLATEDLTVSGSLGSTTLDVAVSASAGAVAAQVNGATASTGVSAEARTQATLSTIGSAGTVSFNLYGSSSTAVAISASVASTSDLTSLADAINAKSASTGITAALSSNKSSITFTSETGDDINIEDFNNTGATKTASFQGLNAFTGATSGGAITLTGGAATDSSTVGGTLRFKSDSSYTVTSAAAGGLFSATTANSSTLTNVASINIGTSTGATSAISVIDGALSAINSQRAALGAYQNRFNSTITNLQTTSENLTASRSRIQDADFASETATLSRNQILQQAGTAMLAQANQLPQQVLSLLR
ncbi:MAG: flagellin [Pseudogulbenkiania sp.]|nr:flagellin [Pseudogulbenkiania sp.]